MSLRNDYPVVIGTTPITIPAMTWSMSLETVETVNTTEDGHDDVELTRLGKRKITASYKVTDSWALFFRSMYSADTVTVSVYDTLTQTYAVIDMRVRNYKESLVRKSDDLSVTNGIYNISFELVEA